MSTILKALRRLEQDRSGETRPLRQDVVNASPDAGSGGGALRMAGVAMLVGAGALGACLVLAFVWLLRDPAGPVSAPETPPVASAPAPATEARRPEPTRRVIRVRPDPDPAPARAAARRSPPPVAAAPPRAARAESPAAKTAPASRIAPGSPPVVIAGEPDEPVIVTTLPAPEPAPDAPRAAAAPKAPPAPPAPSAQPAPSAEIARAPAVAERSPMPPLVVTRTIWHPSSERRLAVLELPDRTLPVELREGDAVGGVVVQQIDPGGVVFLHNGVEIHRRVGARN